MGKLSTILTSCILDAGLCIFDQGAFASQILQNKLQVDDDVVEENVLR